MSCPGYSSNCFPHKGVIYGRQMKIPLCGYTHYIAAGIACIKYLTEVHLL